MILYMGVSQNEVTPPQMVLFFGYDDWYDSEEKDDFKPSRVCPKIWLDPMKPSSLRYGADYEGFDHQLQVLNVSSKKVVSQPNGS